LLAYSGVGFFIEPAFLIGVLNDSVAAFAVLAVGGLAVLVVLAAPVAATGFIPLVAGLAAGGVALSGDAGLGVLALAGAGLAAGGGCAAGGVAFCASACWSPLGGFTSLNDVPHISHSHASAGLEEPQAEQRLRDFDVFVMTSCAGVLQCLTGLTRALPRRRIPCECITPAPQMQPHLRRNAVFLSDSRMQSGLPAAKIVMMSRVSQDHSRIAKINMPSTIFGHEHTSILERLAGDDERDEPADVAG
jgi:hypothetical protein